MKLKKKMMSWTKNEFILLNKLNKLEKKVSQLSGTLKMCKDVMTETQIVFVQNRIKRRKD